MRGLQFNHTFWEEVKDVFIWWVTNSSDVLCSSTDMHNINIWNNENKNDFRGKI